MPKTFERGKNKPRLVPLYHLRTAFTHFLAIFELETFAFRALQVANQKLDEVMPTYIWFLTNTNGFLTREERGERKSCSE